MDNQVMIFSRQLQMWHQDLRDFKPWYVICKEVLVKAMRLLGKKFFFSFFLIIWEENFWEDLNLGSRRKENMPVKHTERVYLGKKGVHCPGEGRVLRMGLFKVWGPAEQFIKQRASNRLPRGSCIKTHSLPNQDKVYTFKKIWAVLESHFSKSTI